MSDEAPQELTPLAERISGPVDGYYLASYALLSSVGYEGYSKVCDSCDKKPRLGAGHVRSDVWRTKMGRATTTK